MWPKKEYVVILLCFCFLLYLSFRNWGKRFQFQGITDEEYRYRAVDLLTNELRCRKILERFFGIPFIKQRPGFLLNPNTGKCLELDGFAPNIPTPIGMGLAFEYNGPQHYKYVPRFHLRGVVDLEEQQKRDAIKKDLCKKEGVILITIPYDTKNLEEFILHEIYRHGLGFYQRG
jgi:hypothetical protein